ncbi:MAG TPA: hypothetical protein VNQ73_00930 [Ilumatobacter sp.]|nr:hypothetical protein [Ilumatobacter sp.]
MIRLGSLGGYPFEGPSVLAGWVPPQRPGVYAIAYRLDPASEQFAIIYVGHADDLSRVGLPFQHARTPCWTERANRYSLYICTYEVPGGTAAHREQIVRELAAIYQPGCNTERYDNAWKDEWIGEYQAPTTGPLTTGRTPTARDQGG